MKLKKKTCKKGTSTLENKSNGLVVVLLTALNAKQSSRKKNIFFFFLFRSDKDGDRSAASSIKGIKILDDLDDWLSEHSKDNGASSKKNNNTASRNSLISTSSDMTGTASAWDELYDRLRATGEIDVENGTHV